MDPKERAALNHQMAKLMTELIEKSPATAYADLMANWTLAKKVAGIFQEPEAPAPRPRLMLVQ